MRSKLSLPLRVELWNGEHIDFSSDPPRVTILVPQPSSLRYLLSPTLYKLGAAYVEGRLDIHGRAADMIRIGSELAAASGPSARRANVLRFLWPHARARDAEAIGDHYDVSNDFYAAWLDPNMVYSCAYFETIGALLAPGGVVMNHGITTTDVAARATPHGGGEFIGQYVFPHGELAHLSMVVKAMQQGGLEVRDVENLRRHYVRTCTLWTENFENRLDTIGALTDARHLRIWRI